MKGLKIRSKNMWIKKKEIDGTKKLVGDKQMFDVSEVHDIGPATLDRRSRHMISPSRGPPTSLLLTAASSSTSH